MQTWRGMWVNLGRFGYHLCTEMELEEEEEDDDDDEDEEEVEMEMEEEEMEVSWRRSLPDALLLECICSWLLWSGRKGRWKGRSSPPWFISAASSVPLSTYSPAQAAVPAMAAMVAAEAADDEDDEDEDEDDEDDEDEDEDEGRMMSSSSIRSCQT
jgi:DNA-directed RNA polymerase specialized sigma24 family protein